MYLALRPPWASSGAPAPIDAGVASAPGDAGPAKPKKKKRRPGGTVTAPSTPAGPGDEEYYEETDTPLVTLSDADRRLEWRGDDVSLPPTRLDLGGGREARPLDDGEINQVIGSQIGGVRDCVVQGATGTDLRATITVQMVVDGSGKVIRSRVQAPHYMFGKNLLGCVQRAARGMKYPGTGAPTLVTVPVNLGG